MEKLFPNRPSPSETEERRAQVLARIEAALRENAPALALEEHDEGGLDPYNTHSGRIRRDVWGARPR